MGFTEASRDGDLKRLREIKEKMGDVAFYKTCCLIDDENGECGLHLAAKEGMMDVCKFLIEEVKVEIDMRSALWSTALILAVEKEHVSLAKYLIHQGAKITLTDIGGFTPLHHLAANEVFDSGRKELMQLFLEKGADIEANSVFGTPLQIAALKGNIEVVKILLDKGAKPNAVCPLIGSPLIFAIFAKAPDCVKLLLKVGADPNASAFGFGDFCYSPSAKPKSETEHCNSSIPAGMQIDANTSASRKRETEDVKSWLPPGVEQNLLNRTGDAPNESLFGLSPLAHAAAARNTEILNNLLDAGADPDSLSTGFMKPIEYAAWKRFHDGINILLPVTKKIPNYPDWSTDGIMDYFHSKEAETMRERARDGYLELASKKGTDAFGKRDHSSAVRWYTLSMYFDPYNARWRINRSLCWARLHEYTFALNDARAGALFAPELAKCLFMEGLAWKLLWNHLRALILFRDAKKLDPQNVLIHDSYGLALKEYVCSVAEKFPSEAAGIAALALESEGMLLP